MTERERAQNQINHNLVENTVTKKTKLKCIMVINLIMCVLNSSILILRLEE